MITKLFYGVPKIFRAARPQVTSLIYRTRFYSTLEDTPIQPLKVINGKPDLNLAITQRAANRLAQIYRDSQEVLRVAVESGGCHGFQYNLKLVSKDDIKLNNEDAKESEQQQENEFDDDEGFEANNDIVYVLPKNQGEVVIDENSLKILNNTTLTYSTELIGSTFKINGGSMKSSCGCGSSFDIDV